MDLIKALQIRALGNVILDDDDHEYRLRFVFRWYSKTFSTPLHKVEELPLVDVLTAYFEEKYEGMGEEELETERARLVETDEERRARELEEANQLAEADEYAREAEAADVKRIERLRAAGKLVEPADKEKGQLVIETMGGGSARVVPDDELAQGRGVVAEDAEPMISMTFMDDSAFDDLLEGHGSMAQPERKR